jgi:hypothetical protein
MIRAAALCVFGMAATTVWVYAHHSLTGIYDSGRQVKIEGLVAQFHFVNPHPFLTVDVKSENGGTQQWRLEMDNRFELTGIGMTAETLKPGDRVIVSGSPGRTESQSLYIRRLDRPADGFRYEQVGSTPRIRVR